MAQRATRNDGSPISDEPILVPARREAMERLIGRAAIALAGIVLVVALDQVLPAPEHVDARWLGLLLVVMVVAYVWGLTLAVATGGIAVAAIAFWLLEAGHAGGLVAQDLVALTFFVCASLAGAIGISRLRARAVAAPSTPLRPPRADPEGPDALTAREKVVLGLLEEGLSNDEIAAQLVVSPNTVKTHLEHLYGKLGVASRGRAVAAGRSRRLIP